MVTITLWAKERASDIPASDGHYPLRSEMEVLSGVSGRHNRFLCDAKRSSKPSKGSHKATTRSRSYATIEEMRVLQDPSEVFGPCDTPREAEDFTEESGCNRAGEAADDKNAGKIFPRDV